MPPTENMDIHPGWDLEQVAQAFQTALEGGTSGQTIPEVNFDQEDLMVQRVHRLKQLLKTLERNDDTEGIALLKDTTLAERVTLTIMKERPDLSLNEVYNNAFEVTTILRTQSQREVKQAYREAHLRERLAIQPVVEEEEKPLVTAPKDKWDLSKVPMPKDEEYLAGNFPVVNFVKDSRVPEEWAALTPRKREMEKRNLTKRAAKFEQHEGRLYRVKRPKNQPNQLPAAASHRQVLSESQRDAVLKQVHDLNGHPSQNQTVHLITERFWWKDMNKQIREYVRTCHACQMANQPTTTRSDGRTLIPTEVNRPFEMVGLRPGRSPS